MTDSGIDDVRTSKQIARDALSDAKRRKVIRDFVVRDGGRATVYSATGSYKAYTTSAIETLHLLSKAERGEW